MKDFLLKLIARNKEEMKKLQERFDASQDVAEVRAIGESLKKLSDEIADAEAQLAQLGNDGNGEEGRSTVPATVELRNAQVVGSFGATGNTVTGGENKDVAYRNAFMEYVVRGTAIPAELRADQNTVTSDVASVIPTHLVNQIIEKFDNVGMILPLITKTSYKAGVEIPTSTTKPEATWTTEGGSSDRQKKTTGKITFTYHKLRCEISMSMEVGTMALSAFEAKFVENVSKAMVKAIEQAIINGDGNGKPKGILQETGVTVVTAQPSYAKLCECEASIPVEYETGAKWCMNKKTFHQILALTDDSGQPIARVNYGLGGTPERTILGRDVVICPYVADNHTFIFDFADYVLNTIYDMGISRKQDWDTEDLLTKAVMSVDGKVVDAGSLVKFELTPII